DELRKVIRIKKDGRFELVPRYFSHFAKGIQMTWNGGAPLVAPIFGQGIIDLFGSARQKGDELTQFHKDLAASVQALTEEIIFILAEQLYQKTKLKNLCLTGGCAQNSVANGKIIQNTSFEHLYVPPAGHDAGTSVGSALYYYHHNLGHTRTAFQNQAYTGAQFNNTEIEKILQTKQVDYTKYTPSDLIEEVSASLAQGQVVGWFQGRAEFGPRALGNRSILVDPSRADARDLLNLKIKRRENFRPFAPSILKEHVGEYFEQVDDVPFMEKVFSIKEEKQALIPAVTHVNGTGRLQTVSQTDAPKYHALIKAFYKKSKVPILLNTSFNENEPIVNTPEEALDCFLRTQMDMLVMEDVIVRRDNK
ncbi:MAG: carbamoyltransferase, partial [Saprospiraceae bacterium]